MSLFGTSFAGRRLFQFRLRGLLLSIVVASIALAWLRDRQRLEREIENRDDLLEVMRTVREAQYRKSRVNSLYTVWSNRITMYPEDVEFDSVEACLKLLRNGKEWPDPSSGKWPAFTFKDSAMAKQALPALFEMLDDQDPKLRRRAAYAIGEIGPRGADDVTRLARSVNDKWNEVRIETLKALQKYKAQASHVAPLLAGMIDGDEPDEAKLLVETIRAIDPSFDLAPPLLTMLRHRRGETRIAAAEFLDDRDLSDRGAMSAVIDLLGDELPACRESAAKAISRTVSPATALPLLLAAFKSEPDPAIRRSMAQVISDTDQKLTAARANE